MSALKPIKQNKSISIPILIFSLLVVTFAVHRVSHWAPPPPILSDNKHPDVWYHYRDSQLIYKGTNPYILWETDPNNKPLGYFPLFNMIGALPMYLGFTSYDQWTNVMRILFFISELSVGVFLFEISRYVKKPVLGLLGAGTWFFNLATIKVWEIQQTDSIVVFLALLGVYYLEKRPDLANLILGVSIGIKQITMFLIPLFLLVQVRIISEQNKSKTGQIVVFARTLFLIAIINLITSLPFLLLDYKTFFRGFLTEGVENPASSTYLTGGYHRVFYNLFLNSLPAPFLRVPVVFAYLGLYVTYIRQRFNKYLFSGIVFLTYIYFSPIVWEQYFVWPIPFILVPIIKNVTIGNKPTQNNKNKMIKIRFEPLDEESTQFNRLKYSIKRIKNAFKWQKEFILLVGVLIVIVTILSYYLINHGLFSIVMIFSLVGYIGVALLIYGVGIEQNRPLLGLFGATFWLCNPAAILALQQTWWAHPLLLLLLMMIPASLVESHNMMNAFRISALAASLIFYFIHYWYFLWIVLIGLIASILLYTTVENVNSTYI